MKDDYRETKSGREVKYDSDPENDYSDGYNAGRRYEAPKPPKKSWLWLLLLLLLLGLLVAGLLSQGLFKASKDDAKATPTPISAPTAAPQPVAPSPSSLPAVGSHD